MESSGYAHWCVRSFSFPSSFVCWLGLAGKRSLTCSMFPSVSVGLRICWEMQRREACRSETQAQQQATERPLCGRFPPAHGSERWHWCRAAAQETCKVNKRTGLLRITYQTELRGKAVVKTISVKCESEQEVWSQIRPLYLIYLFFWYFALSTRGSYMLKE